MGPSLIPHGISEIVDSRLFEKIRIEANTWDFEQGINYIKYWWKWDNISSCSADERGNQAIESDTLIKSFGHFGWASLWLQKPGKDSLFVARVDKFYDYVCKACLIIVQKRGASFGNGNHASWWRFQIWLHSHWFWNILVCDLGSGCWVLRRIE